MQITLATTDRELHLTGSIDAPVELVWKVWAKAIMNPKHLMIILLFLCNTTYAQKYVFIDKDVRIVKHEREIIELLATDGQFGVVHKPYKVSDYIDEITIKKEYELYNQDGKDILLIKFESLGDHVDGYYGLIVNGNAFLFHNMDDKGFIEFCEMINNSKTIALIKNYLKEYPADEYHGHEFTIEKDTDVIKKKH